MKLTVKINLGPRALELTLAKRLTPLYLTGSPVTSSSQNSEEAS
jgi:hypothetical protein